VLAVGIAVAVADFFGAFEPSHYVAITNDTKTTVHWSCTWSDLNIAPGQTGAIRIWNTPDRDFGCVSAAGTSHEIDMCPPVWGATQKPHFSVSSWVRQFPCV